MQRTIFLSLALAGILFGNRAVFASHLTVEQVKHLRLPEVAIDSAEAQTNAQHTSLVRLKGVIGEHIRFELLLPEHWNERFVMGGGGGFVGSVQNGAADSVNHGYATVGTDTGHESPGGITAGWALDNVEAQVDFGYLAVHRTGVVAKALVRLYYGMDPSYSYFVGCSRGGGQAMMESQRFPVDFDGIVAGAPAFDWTGIAANVVAIQKVLYPDPKILDKTALDVPALQALSKSIVEQCDARDGLTDGVVQDPPSAGFELAKVPGLTDQQRAAIAAIYHGAEYNGKTLYPGYTPGAECDVNQWKAWIVGPMPGLASVQAPDLMYSFGTQIFKYLIFDNPDWDYSTYNFSNFAQDTRRAASFLNATNANLDTLKARKGKLILWHGWADTALPAQATIGYYRQVEAHDPEAPAYCRLFLVPGCLHCGGGPGASEVDWLAVIRDWVETQHAPDRVIATRRAGGKIERTRPLFYYPQVAVYKGSGDPNSAENFAVKPGSR